MMTDSPASNGDQTPPTRYSSFLLRCWHVGEDELRIKLEHIQSGTSTQVNTYEAAFAWLSGHSARSVADQSPLSGQGSLRDDEVP